MSRFALPFCLLALLLVGCPDDDGPTASGDTSMADTSGADAGVDGGADTATTADASGDTGSTSDVVASGDFAGSCDGIGGGNQCNEYPTSLSAAELESVRTNCPGTWNEGVPCPNGWNAACVDFTAGNLQSQYYYNGAGGMGEDACTGMGGSWSSSLPDYAGSCQKNAYECWDYIGEFDTPQIVRDSCEPGGGTYLADRCSTDDLAARCTQEPFKVYNYYVGSPDLARAELFCSQIGAAWETF